ncbi:MAG TPA: hypothetical protein VNN07_02160 [Candidatus Tectomicrobia bacterium]|nr:hypothetical protein [Candidatus Tectomicrobia bacterium]
MGRADDVDAAIEFHPVMVALSGARALAWALNEIADGDSMLHEALSDRSAPESARGWIQEAIAERLLAALTDAEAAFRKSLTPEQARAQVVFGEPKEAA